MAKHKLATRKKRGPTGRTLIVGFRLDAVTMSKVDAVASTHGHETRTAAIRHLIERGLAACLTRRDVLMSDNDTPCEPNTTNLLRSPQPGQAE